VWGNNWVDRAAVEGAGGIKMEYGITSVVARVAATTEASKSLFPFEEEKLMSSVIEHVVPTQKKVATRQTDIRNWFSTM
jgi:hypothetical protein